MYGKKAAKKIGGTAGRGGFSVRSRFFSKDGDEIVITSGWRSSDNSASDKDAESASKRVGDNTTLDTTATSWADQMHNNLIFSSFGGVTEIRRYHDLNRIKAVINDGKCCGFTKAELMTIAERMD